MQTRSGPHAGSAVARPRRRALSTEALSVAQLPDVEQALGWIVAGFNLLYIVTASAGFHRFVTDVPAGGVIIITSFVVVPVLVTAALAVFHHVTRFVWAISLVGYLGAALGWSVCFSSPRDVADPPWVLAMLIPGVLQAVMATRSLRGTAAILVASATALGAGEVAFGAVPPFSVLTQILLIAPFGMLLAIIVTLVRRVAARTRAAQAATLREVLAARFDDVTEAERVRTDALVHDTILTTLLQASSAEEDDETTRAHLMAENALRVIAHVSRTRELGAGVRLRSAVSAHEQHLDPLIRDFDIVLDDLALEDLLLPSDAADALLVAMSEAMDNSVRHAAAQRRIVHLRPLGPDGVRIEVDDDGRGFEYPTRIGAGIRDRILIPMRAVEGRADLSSIVGSGTSVRLSWGSVSVSDVRTVDVRLEEPGA